MSKEEFNFMPPSRSPLFKLSEEFGYLNSLASRILLEQGRWVSFEADPERQAILFKPQMEAGPGRHKLHSPTGNALHVRGSLRNYGMEFGTYIYLGDNVFQHMEHIQA